MHATGLTGTTIWDKSDCETFLDCATNIAKLFGCIAELLRCIAKLFGSIAKLFLRNSDCAITIISELMGRISQLLARIAKLFLRN